MNMHDYKRGTSNTGATKNGAKPQIIKTYDYNDATGKLLYQVLRYDPKDFKQRKPDGKGGFIYKNVFDGVTRVPYRLPHLLAHPDAPIFVCEGEKDADRVTSLDLNPCATTVASHKWTPDIANVLKGRDVYILADNDDVGRQAALDAAGALNGKAKSIRIVTLPGLAERGDVSDWLDADPARDTVALVTECLKVPEWNETQQPPASKFRLTAIDDVTLSNEPFWQVDQVVPVGPSLGVIGGKAKSGKTFVAIDLFFHVAMNRSYHNLAVQGGAVVYVTNEGVRGFDRRMVALRQHYDVEGQGVPFYVVHTMPDMGSKSGDAEKLIASIQASVPGRVATVVVDTLARAMTGKNDSDPTDMSTFITNCSTISEALGCFTCAVHHSPRSDDARLRGSNQLDGALDVFILVTHDEVTGISTATVDMMKDGEEGMSWRFRVTAQDVKAHGFEDRAVGLCTVLGNPKRADQSARTNKAESVRLSAGQQRFYEVLCETVIDHGAPVPGSGMIPFNSKAVTREQFKLYLKTKGFFDKHKTENSIRARISEGLNMLAGKHMIGLDAERIWLRDEL